MNANTIVSPYFFHQLCLRIAENLSEDLAFGNEIVETVGDVADNYDYTCSYAFSEPLTSDQVLMLKSVFRSYGYETGNTAFVRGGRYLTLWFVSGGIGEPENRKLATAVA